MPPIMGAAAFVMAEFLGVSYGQVVIWALIPAMLYYVACFCGGAFRGQAPRPCRRAARRNCRSSATVMRERGHLFIPVLVDPRRDVFRLSARRWRRWPARWPASRSRRCASRRATTCTLENVIGACVDGARNALPVAMACACAGIVIGVRDAVRARHRVHAVRRRTCRRTTLLLALILTMIAGIVLGMGMPTTPAYIIMTALLVPAIIKFGVDRAGRAHVRVLLRRSCRRSRRRSRWRCSPPPASRSPTCGRPAGRRCGSAAPASSCRSCSSTSRRC